jgi:hypothetical protein
VHQSYRIKHLYDESEGIVVKAYDESVFNILYNSKVLLPVPAHGDQLAIQSYCRMMVKQFDDTQAYKPLFDYAFVNYLYYFGILSETVKIDFIDIARQGTGAVNAIDHALIREDPGFDNSTMIVYNLKMGEGLHPSWAVYQYSTDAEILEYIDDKAEKIVSNLNYTHPIYEININPTKLQANLVVKPSIGYHRPNKDAIFATAEGCDLENLILFLQSIQDSGFDGDVVISISKSDSSNLEIMNYLSYQSKRMSGLIVYIGLMVGWEDYYEVTVEGDNILPIKKYISVARYDIFWAWSTEYDSSVTLLITVANDSYFQSNPFTNTTSCYSKWHLHLYKDAFSTINFHGFIKKRKQRDILSNVMGIDTMREMSSDEQQHLLVNPDIMMGHQHAVEQHLRQMMKIFETKKCYSQHCDVAVQNYIWYHDVNQIDNKSPDYVIECHEQGLHLINPVSPNLYKNKLFDENRKLFLNWDFQVASPVVYRYDLVPETRSWMEKKKRSMIKNYLSRLISV